MKKKIRLLAYLLTVLVFVIMLTNSCKKDEDNNNKSKLPYIGTLRVSNITLTSAISGGYFPIKVTDTIIAKGVCWSTNQNPTIADSKTSDGIENDNFTSNITGLTANTTYHLRAYATFKAGTAYGDEVIFKSYTGTTTDIDGNIYYTVTIGTQIWMAENLKTTKYRNGDPIPNAIEDSVWWKPNNKAYCNYNNDTNNGNIYGRLYNWWVVVDPRNLAPTGWHVPSDGEWTLLIKSLGDDSLAGSLLMESGGHWSCLAWGDETNASGFTALPGGYRNSIGGFADLSTRGNWWTSTDYSVDFAKYLYIWCNSRSVIKNTIQKISGASVRCIKD